MSYLIIVYNKHIIYSTNKLFFNINKLVGRINIGLELHNGILATVRDLSRTKGSLQLQCLVILNHGNITKLDP